MDKIHYCMLKALNFGENIDKNIKLMSLTVSDKEIMAALMRERAIAHDRWCHFYFVPISMGIILATIQYFTKEEPLTFWMTLQHLCDFILGLVWIIMAHTKKSTNLAVRFNTFGWAASVQVFYTGALKCWVLYKYYDSVSSDPRIMDYIDIYYYYFIVTNFWCFEDFRLTVFVKVPLFTLFNTYIMQVKYQILELQTGQEQINDITIYASRIITLFGMSLVFSYLRNLDITQLVVRQELQKRQQAQLTDILNAHDDGIICFTTNDQQEQTNSDSKMVKDSHNQFEFEDMQSLSLNQNAKIDISLFNDSVVQLTSVEFDESLRQSIGPKTSQNDKNLQESKSNSLNKSNNRTNKYQITATNDAMSADGKQTLSYSEFSSLGLDFCKSRVFSFDVDQLSSTSLLSIGRSNPSTVSDQNSVNKKAQNFYEQANDDNRNALLQKDVKTTENNLQGQKFSLAEILVNYQKLFFNSKSALMNLETRNSKKQLQLEVQPIILGDKQCQMLKIRDLSTIYQLKSMKVENNFLELLTATVTHEMMQPLNCVIGFATTMLDRINIQLQNQQTEKNGLSQREIQEQARIMKLIINSAKLLRIYIRDLLDRTLLDQNKFEPNLQYHDINKVANEAIEILDHQARLQKIQIVLKSSIPTTEQIIMDSQRFQQVMINLLSNSLKFSKAGSKIKFQIGKNKDMIIVKVNDQGIGISEQNVKKLFKPFVKVNDDQESMRMNPSGIGLGLSICKHICQQFNGDINCQSQQGVGTQMIFTMESKEQSNQLLTAHLNEQNQIEFEKLNQESARNQQEISYREIQKLKKNLNQSHEDLNTPSRQNSSNYKSSYARPSIEPIMQNANEVSFEIDQEIQKGSSRN